MYRKGLQGLNDRLASTRDALDRRLWLEGQLELASDQLVELAHKAAELDKAVADEQRDVDKLEGKGLTAFLAALLHTREQKLDEERQEALQAVLRRDEARHEHEELVQAIEAMKEEVRSLGGAEEALAALEVEREGWILHHGGEDGEALRRLDAEATKLSRIERELQEAIAAGKTASVEVAAVRKVLEAARKWGTADMLGAGGLITTAMKHAKVDKARDLLLSAQGTLRAFERMVGDEALRTPPDLDIDAPTRLTDYLIDGMFGSWTTQSKIDRALSSVFETQSRLSSIVAHLEGRLEATAREAGEVEAERAALLRMWEQPSTL